MLKFLLCSTIFTFFISCSADESYDSQERPVPIPNKLTGKPIEFPANPANEFDIAGKLEYEISEAYYLSPSGTSISEVITAVETLANTKGEFTALRPVGYVSPSAVTLSSYLANPVSSAANIISNAPISTKAKASISDFTETLLLYKAQQQPYTSMYSYIINYENSVVADTQFSANDRKTILTESSIARYALYFAGRHKRKPRDQDWDTSMIHLRVSVDGIQDNTAKAIVMSVVISMYENVDNSGSI